MLKSLFILFAFVASPAFATAWVHCSDAGGEASFDYFATDGIDVLSVSAVTVTAADKVWASDAANGPGEPISIGQAFEDADTVRIDAIDKDFHRLASVRLFKAQENDAAVMGGTLTVRGFGAWAVSCSPDGGA